MAFKTIVIHFNDEARAPALAAAAVDLGQRSEAHLLGLYAVPPVPVGKGFAGGIIEAGLATYRAEAQRIAEAFRAATGGRSVAAEWRLVESRHRDVADSVITAARTADLVVVAESDPRWASSPILDKPERIAVETGRPTLVVPRGGAKPEFGRRIVVAWNGRREAARAAFDALPLLKAAKDVHVLSIGSADEEDGPPRATAAEIAASLVRHGVHCDVVDVTAEGRSVGATVLASVKDLKADMLVMGAYGHARLTEFVFGGVTRHILRHVEVPVLLSH